MGFAVLQPVSAALLTVLLLGTGFVVSCRSNSSTSTSTSIGNTAADSTVGACLDPIEWGAVVGMMGVFVGLYLVMITEPKVTLKKKISTQYENSNSSSSSSSNTRHESLMTGGKSNNARMEEVMVEGMAEEGDEQLQRPLL